MTTLIKYTVISFLVFTGLGILGVLILGELPESVIIVNPYTNPVIYFCAYSSIIFGVVGLLSIFIKSLRVPVGVAFGVLLLLFLIFACWNAVLQNVSYRVARTGEPVEKTVVIVDDDNISEELTFRFFEDGKEKDIAADVPYYAYYRLHEGDTCVAVVWDGLLGVRFISKLKNVRRNNSNQ